MDLGEKIQALRRNQGLSQEQLSEKVNVSRQAISKWELNETVPDIENIVQLSKTFGVSTDYLLGLESEIQDGSEKKGKADELMKTFRRLRMLSICLMIIGFVIAFMFWIISKLSPVVIDIGGNQRIEGFSAFLDFYNLSIFNSSMIAMGIVGIIVFIVACVGILMRKRKL